MNLKEYFKKIKFDKDTIIYMILVFFRILFYGMTFVQVNISMKEKINPKVLFDSLSNFRIIGFLPLMLITIVYLLFKKKYVQMLVFSLFDFFMMYILFSMSTNYMIK